MTHYVEAPAVCPHWQDGQHSPMQLYCRPWWRFFRKTTFWICITCSRQPDSPMALLPEDSTW